ncbi:MAG: Nramp family divalent metal transporter [Gemmatimonadetes bacterium]|nr:Nramp family divalent metal transporter [Gemmatimonadota bacterium]
MAAPDGTRAPPQPPGAPPRRPPGARRGGGPGWLVAAAFIGPGTVTTATLAGARFGTALLWALLFSMLATMALQEMAARLGLITGKGLGEAIRGQFQAPLARAAAVGLVIAAIAVGNAAYETGNLLGGALGLQALAGWDVRGWSLVVAAVAFALLWSGSYRVVQRFMVVMVGLMSVTFLATAATVLPSLPELLSSLVLPSIPDGSILLAVGLVGTTVVPYNLFLHAAAVREVWSGEEDLPRARRDLVVSIGVGGAVSMAVLVTSAGVLHPVGAAEAAALDAAGMARQLEPVLGQWARAFFAIGLCAAGATSTITAPLAAAWATAGALGWDQDLRSGRMRAVWGAVLGAGVVMALVGVRPVPAILFAQAANGILLPAVACFLLLAANDRRRMGRRANGWAANLVGVVVVGVALLLGARAVINVLGAL